MDRRQVLTMIVAGTAGVAAAAAPELWRPEKHRSAHAAAARRAPAPPPDPGFAPARSMRAVTSPVHSLRDLAPAAPPNAVALTIDDGPHPYWTPKVLDVLAERGVHATFNMIGEQVPENARLVQRIVAAGHQIADHTLTHPINLPKLPAQPGDILLCHDGGGDRSQTVTALRTVIPALKQRGLTFVAL
ncbi:polysaccharide deacetylase family protein [Spirillospora sp. NPDC046719]